MRLVLATEEKPRSVSLAFLLLVMCTGYISTHLLVVLMKTIKSGGADQVYLAMAVVFLSAFVYFFLNMVCVFLSGYVVWGVKLQRKK